MRTWAWDKDFVLCQDEEGVFGIVPVGVWLKAMKRFNEWEVG